jgi:hypothetical protein
MEEQHDEALQRGVEALLELPIAAVDARRLTAEVDSILNREAVAQKAFRDAVVRVRFEAQNVSRWAYRNAVVPGENDQTLVREWASAHGSANYRVAAMESARCAELVALALYRDLYGWAEDLSILQLLSPSDCRWRTADIASNGKWVDVKNARRSYSSPEAYSEHTVKRFKADCFNRDVVISGFLSPYLTDSGFSRTEQVVWLGETTLMIVERLKRDFESDYLQLDFSRDRLTLMPPWLFDYPLECYADRDAAIRAVRSEKHVIPTSDCLLGLLLTGRIAGSPCGDIVLNEVVMLGQRLKGDTTPTRPTLFLHILDRFCDTTRKGIPFPANALRQILFSAGPLTTPQFPANATPLAVFDPLEVVKALVDVLEEVSATCGQRAASFTSFKLAGPSIFQARRDSGNWQTLFAYCGGWRRLRNGGVVKCGQSPLFLGQNDPCDECGRLVCHQCGYCTERCQVCRPRQAEWPLR